VPFARSLHHNLQKCLFDEAVVEKNALEKTAGPERPHSGLGGEVYRLVVDQVHLIAVDTQGEQELAAEAQNLEERFDIFSDLLRQLPVGAELVPLLPEGVVLELLVDELRPVLPEAELDGVQGMNLVAGGVA
jgi:hypothetical protein